VPANVPVVCNGAAGASRIECARAACAATSCSASWSKSNGMASFFGEPQVVQPSEYLRLWPELDDRVRPAAERRPAPEAAAPKREGNEAVKSWEKAIERMLAAFDAQGAPVGGDSLPEPNLLGSQAGVGVQAPRTVRSAASVLEHVQRGQLLSPRSKYGKGWREEGVRQAALPSALVTQHRLHGVEYFQGSWEAMKREAKFAKGVQVCEMRLSRMGWVHPTAGLDASEVMLHQRAHLARTKLETLKVHNSQKVIKSLRRKYQPGKKRQRGRARKAGKGDQPALSAASGAAGYLGPA